MRLLEREQPLDQLRRLQAEAAGGAAAAFRALGSELDAAPAEADGGEEAALRLALASFERLGARAAVARLTRALRARGAKAIPRGPRQSTRAGPAGLTSREREVLSQLAAGLRNAEIARRLHVSAKTIDHHLSAIFGKLQVRNRTEAVRKARGLGLAPPD